MVGQPARLERAAPVFFDRFLATGVGSLGIEIAFVQPSSKKLDSACIFCLT